MVANKEAQKKKKNLKKEKKKEKPKGSVIAKLNPMDKDKLKAKSQRSVKSPKSMKLRRKDEIAREENSIHLLTMKDVSGNREEKGASPSVSRRRASSEAPPRIIVSPEHSQDNMLAPGFSPEEKRRKDREEPKKKKKKEEEEEEVDEENCSLEEPWHTTEELEQKDKDNRKRSLSEGKGRVTGADSNPVEEAGLLDLKVTFHPYADPLIDL